MANILKKEKKERKLYGQQDRLAGA